MSQPGRESFTDKISAAVKPDSQKTFGEQAGDWTKGKGDSLAFTVQPQQNKVTHMESLGRSQWQPVSTLSLHPPSNGSLGLTASGRNHNVHDRSFFDKTKDFVGIDRNSNTGSHSAGTNF